jgi:hypothetical protein
VVGNYTDREEALVKTLENYKMGQFLIQKITKNDDEIIQRFSSRVYV